MFVLMLFKTIQFFFEESFTFQRKIDVFFTKNIPACPFQSIAIHFNESLNIWGNEILIERFQIKLFYARRKDYLKMSLKIIFRFFGQAIYLVHRIHYIGKCCLKNTLYEKSSFFVYDFVIIYLRPREPEVQSVDSYI